MAYIHMREQLFTILIKFLWTLKKANLKSSFQLQLPCLLLLHVGRRRMRKSLSRKDVKDHIDDFINASMDEHKTCFKKTVKMFGLSQAVAERKSNEVKEVESSLPLQTTVQS